MLIDKATVITGSFNFTKAAEGNNAENPRVIGPKVHASTCIENWVRHKGHSENMREAGTSRS
jgi:phosphatidylserine/phosphatidylglycerophosphate/cardiolipin synthase-like enzyme